MKCLHPLYVRYKPKKINDLDERGDEDFIKVPCRKCPECQRKISLEWTRRILHEYESSGYQGYFITLTFDEQYLSDNTSLNKIDIQLYLKRLRKNSKKYIKYFACGEYGEKYGRPHYHLIIIGLNKTHKETIEKSWGLGIVDIKQINYATVKYVVDYLHKKIPEEIINGRTRPFTLKSKGLGKNWFFKNKDEIIEDKCIITNGYKTSIPRYYLKKLKISDNDMYNYLLEKSPDAIPETFVTKIYYKQDHIDAELERQNNEQHNKNIASLKRLK